MHQRILAGIILSLTAAATIAAPISGQGTWETTLQGRLPLTPGGTDYQAYYDTDLNITWLADANLGLTNSFGIPPCDPHATVYFNCIWARDGAMDWYSAQAWVAAMNTAHYLGASDWRLPTVKDTGNPGCDDPAAFGGTDCGYNVDLTTGEMAHLYYSTLGNTAYFDSTGASTLCATVPTGPSNTVVCFTNTGPFSNFPEHSQYWSGTTYAPYPGSAWFFSFDAAFQGAQDLKEDSFWVWAVADGDVLAPVPLPAVGWLLAPAFGVFGVRRRRVLSN